MKSSDLILINSSGEVIKGGSNKLLNKAAYMIHHSVHTARPDVIYAVHCHSLYSQAFYALGRLINPLTQDSIAFHDDVSIYGEFQGVVLTGEEGVEIAEALGKNKAYILLNHGLLTIGQTVEAALF